MLASHLIVPVEWRTTSRLLWHYNDGPAVLASFASRNAAVPCLGGAFSHYPAVHTGVPTSASINHSAVLAILFSSSAAILCRAPAHHPAVLAIRSSCSAAFAEFCTMTGPQVFLPISMPCSPFAHLAVQQRRAVHIGRLTSDSVHFPAVLVIRLKYSCQQYRAVHNGGPTRIWPLTCSFCYSLV